MSVDKQGDLRIDSWLIKIFLTNGEEKTIVDLPEEISQSIDESLTEIEEDLICSIGCVKFMHKMVSMNIPLDIYTMTSS
jgi:hypothetical protein